MPLQAIADDLTQFEVHQPALECRWREDAGLRERFNKTLRGRRTKEVAEVGLREGINLTAPAANLAVPGLGFVLLAARWGVQKLREERRDHAAPLDAADRMALAIFGPDFDMRRSDSPG